MPNLKSVSPDGIKESDIVIALMGPTGSGKSTFIDVATRQDGSTVGHGLESMTSEIRAVRFKHPDLPHTVVLVDTPGFDDTHRPDTEILKMIAGWLKVTYKSDKKLSAILYLHRINDNRMAGSLLRNLKMFNQLCGDGALRNVIIVTTMWARVSTTVGDKREGELMNTYWKAMLDANASTARFAKTYESAWNVITGATDKGKNGLLVQEEMVDFEKRLSETQAGQTLFKELQALLVKQREIMDNLQKQAKAQTDPNLVAELEREYGEIQERWKATLDEAQEMKIPFGRRLRMFFVRKGPTAKPVTIA